MFSHDGAHIKTSFITLIIILCFIIQSLHANTCTVIINLNERKNALNKMSLNMRKPAFCKCENKDADQLRSNREADQRLCFRYMDSTIPLLP